MHEKRVLIIEDDDRSAELVATIFVRVGANAHAVSNGQAGLQAFYALQPDLVIIDIGLPDMNGWQLCKRIRELSQVPILFVTAMDDAASIIRGLELGADDFISKPYSPGVLLARANAVLRRTRQLVESGDTPSITQTGYADHRLTINLYTIQVQVLGQPIKLSRTEWRLLRYFVQNIDRLLPTKQILKQVWGQEYHNDTQYVYTYIHRLRQKLEADPNLPQYLISEHGIGFRFKTADPHSLTA